MRKSRHKRNIVLGLDSLVDIVSNTVGILLILAVFMALLAQIDLPGEDAREVQPQLERPVQRLLIPWAHATHKNAAFFHLKGNRVQVIDLAAFYEKLAERERLPGDIPLLIEQPGLETRFYPVTNYVYCLEFRPTGETGETLLEMRKPGSDWQQARSRHSAERFFYFFWVAGDSFEMFREIRESLWEQNVEVGWKPVRDKQPLEICNGFDDSRSFQPQ